MGSIISAAWGSFSLASRIITILSLVATISGAVYWTYDKIESSGYNRAMKEIADKKAKDEKTAAVKIKESGVKYDTIKKKLRAQEGYNAPVSSLSGSAISGMPSPSRSGH